jgi:hypothetical protein
VPARVKITLDPVGTCGTIHHVALRLLIVVAIAFAGRDASAQVFRARGKLAVKPTPITAKAIAAAPTPAPAAPAAPGTAPKATPAPAAAEKKPVARKVTKKKKRRKSDDVVIEDEDDDVQIKDDE